MDEDLNKLFDEAKALLILRDSEGGVLIREGLESDIEGLVRVLTRKYRDSTHIELISLIAALEAKKDLLDKIENSKENVNNLKEEYEEGNKK